MSIRIKVCGVTSVDDALAAAELGVDAIGLVFAPGSPRCISLALAAEIVDALPPFVSTVALLRNQSRRFVTEVITAIHPHYLQFHGSESPEYCDSFQSPYIKAIGMADPINFVRQTQGWKGASALLLDGHGDGEAGGQGKCFNWATIPANYEQALILAGGLTADNVAEAIGQSGLKAVDVSSGVEHSPGIKSVEKMRAFVSNARSG